MTFAEFSTAGTGEVWHDVRVRPLGACDVEPVAALLAAREDRDPRRALETVTRWAAPTQDRIVLVAERQGRIGGYGKAELLTPREHGGRAPAGWYLTGLVVAAGMRRHGIGALLTERRISALAGMADEVWYFANLRNRASVALHERLGFELLTRDFEIPGVTFAGGHGGLFRLSLSAA